MDLLFYLAVMLFAGLLLGRLMKLIKLPNVTGYLVAGLILGPFVTKVLDTEAVQSLGTISNMALAFIAFTVGLSFKTSYFRKVGLTPVVIAFLEALLAVFFVVGALIAAGFPPAFSIVLGAIAAATAPAATVMVIKQYNAKGPVTDTLIAVVAIDDAVALVLFGFAVSIAGILNGNADGNLLMSIFKPIYQVLLALLIGAVMGILFKIPLKFFKKIGNRLIIIIGFVFITSAIATMLGVSELLACMAMGCVFCNISTESDGINDLCDLITPPLFELFFVVSGAGLDISVLPQIGIMGTIYVIVRCIGKWCGAFIGAKIMNADKKVCAYLGPTLFPQAGVAIGLTMVAQTVVPEYAPEIRAVILCGTLIYELVGPAITKISLKKAGEIN